MSRGNHTEQLVHRPPETCPAGCGWLLTAAVAASVYGIAAAIEHTHHPAVDLDGSVYGVALAAFLAGVCGYLARSEGARVLREQAAERAAERAELAEIRAELAALRQATERPRPAGRAYLSTACGRARVVDATTMPALSPVEREGYWKVYTDVLEDLGGLDGKPPTEG